MLGYIILNSTLHPRRIVLVLLLFYVFYNKTFSMLCMGTIDRGVVDPGVLVIFEFVVFLNKVGSGSCLNFKFKILVNEVIIDY